MGAWCTDEAQRSATTSCLTCRVCASGGAGSWTLSLVRLNAFLARAGIASRRGADELIKAGRVRVNGETGKLNTFVAGRDVVEGDGRRVRPQELTYVLLHKPAGVVTTARDPRGRPTVVGLVRARARALPVGRL